MQHANHLISIIGPTAVGKTSFALNLIDYFQENSPDKYTGFDIISADSRQVYRDLKIISGADVPKDFFEEGNYFKRVWYSQKKDTRIYGIGMLEYKDEWSVAHFRNFAQKILRESWGKGRLPMIVGGTGLYHEHLFNLSPILDIKPNVKLRLEFDDWTVLDLQKKLQKIDLKKFASLNQSDKNNKMRLVRALEVAEFKQKQQVESSQSSNPPLNPLPEFRTLTIGLKDTLENIKHKIEQRVAERFKSGAQQEVARIQFLTEELGINKQVVSALGVREIGAYLDGQVESQECQEKWALREFQYAKRQFTWWKKRPDIKWLLIDKIGHSSLKSLILFKIKGATWENQ